jgi:hypothetical protein
MAMTPNEAAAFYEEQAEESARFAQAARENRDFHLLVLNQKQFIAEALTSGLVRWRRRVGDPRPVFRRAVTGSATFLAEGTEVDPSQMPWKHVWFELTDYLRTLLGEPVDGPFLAQCLGDRLPDKQEFDDLGLGDRFAGLAVVLRLATGRAWPLWHELLDRRAQNKRAALFVQTYAGYWDLLDAIEAGDAREASERALQLGSLYAKRKRDPYYSGGIQFEGGGPDNDDVLDFRLAAILKSASARGLSLPPQFVHQWAY